MNFQRFEFEPNGEMLYRAPGLDLEYISWKTMRMFSFRKTCDKVESADLLLELPGPIYLFRISFIPFGILDREVYAINGVLTNFVIDVPYDSGLLQDGKERVMMYFGHLLLFCFCKPKYKPPFHLHRFDSAKWTDDLETRRAFYERICTALPALGYASLGDFMPILKGLELDDIGSVFLDGKHYNSTAEDPISIETFINFDDVKAFETSPIFHRLSRHR